MSFKVGDVVILVDDVLDLKDAEGSITEILIGDKNTGDKDMLRIDFRNKREYLLWPERVKKVRLSMWLELENSLSEIDIHG